MIELRRMKGIESTSILEVLCNDDTPQDLFMRFVRAKVSMENLLPASTILRTSRKAGPESASLRWEVALLDVPVHLALVRAALDIMRIEYLDMTDFPLAVNGKSSVRGTR